MSEPLWVSARYRGLDPQGRQQWEAAVTDGERRVGPVVKSHSRKSARSEAYGALGAMNRIAELERELEQYRRHVEEKIEPKLLERAEKAERELERLRVPGILPFLCPICGRKRMEYRKEGLALFVECTKCGADHETICDVALAEQPEERP